MTTYTLQDLAAAKGTSEPVRQMLFALAKENEALRQANLDCVNHFEVAMADIDELRTQVAKLSKDAERYKSALRKHIRMYRVDDQAYDPEKETSRLLAIAIDAQKGKV